MNIFIVPLALLFYDAFKLHHKTSPLLFFLARNNVML